MITKSSPVNGRQPENELLFVIGIPTGAYIFGDDYPSKFFQDFWLELKRYNPDYIDECNHNIYWKIENAKEICNNFEAILQKYHSLNKEDFNNREIEKLKKEIEKLEAR